MQVKQLESNIKDKEAIIQELQAKLAKAEESMKREQGEVKEVKEQVAIHVLVARHILKCRKLNYCMAWTRR